MCACQYAITYANTAITNVPLTARRMHWLTPSYCRSPCSTGGQSAASVVLRSIACMPVSRCEASWIWTCSDEYWPREQGWDRAADRNGHGGDDTTAVPTLGPRAMALGLGHRAPGRALGLRLWSRTIDRDGVEGRTAFHGATTCPSLGTTPSLACAV